MDAEELSGTCRGTALRGPTSLNHLVLIPVQNNWLRGFGYQRGLLTSGGPVPVPSHSRPSGCQHQASPRPLSPHLTTQLSNQINFDIILSEM